MIRGARPAHDHGMDTNAAAILALVLAGDIDGARMLGATDGALAVAHAARLVLADLALDTDAFTLAEAVTIARWEVALSA